MNQKKRFELVFKTDGSDKERTAIDKVLQLIEGLVAISNGEAVRSRMSLRVNLKAK